MTLSESYGLFGLLETIMEKLWNSNYLKVMTSNFATSFAFYIITPLLPLYLSERFGATKDMIGLVLSGYTLTALLMRPFSGFLIDTFPRKRVLMICISAFAFFFGCYLLASSLLLFAIVRTLHGAPFGALTVANSTVAIDVLPPERRNEGIGYYGLSNNIATAIAPSIGLYVYRYAHDFDLLFWLALLSACIGLAADVSIRVPVRPPVEGRRKLSLDRFFLTRGWLLGVNMIFFGFCYGILSNYLAIYGKEVMGITSGTGTYFLLLSLGLMASRLQGVKALRQGRLTHNAAEGVIISAIGYTLFIASPTMIGYYGSAILIGLGNGHMWPAFQSMFINMAHHNERGTATSTLLTSWDLGIGLGAILGGILAEHMGYATAFWTSAAANIGGALLFLGLTRRFFNRHRLE